jgi:DNA-binding XRE family transcriptional regulator
MMRIISFAMEAIVGAMLQAFGMAEAATPGLRRRWHLLEPLGRLPRQRPPQDLFRPLARGGLARLCRRREDQAGPGLGDSGGRSRRGRAGLLAENRGHQLAETRRQLGLAQKDIAAALGVSIARFSQIEHGEVMTFEVIARYVEALGGRLDLVADFGDRTVRLPVSDNTPTAA